MLCSMGQSDNTSLFRQERHCMVIKILHFLGQLIEAENCFTAIIER